MGNKTTQTAVPRLRFPEFSDAKEWASKPLNSILDYERPDNFIVSDTRYKNEGTPVLTANKSFILGYTDEVDGIYQDIPVIIFDDFTTDKKYVDFPFKVKSSAIKILKSKKEDNLRLISELMDRIRFSAENHKRYYISEYQNLSIFLPGKDEQQKIADCLSSINELITAAKQKLVTLQDHKRGLMQQLFPTKDKTTPMLRFPEFRDAKRWEEKKFEEIFTLKKTNSFSRDKLTSKGGTVKNIHYDDIYTKFSTHFNVEEERAPYVIKSEPLDKISSEDYCIEGDLVFAGASEDIYDVGKCIEIVRLNNEKLISGMHTILARPQKATLVVSFAGYLFCSNNIRDQIRSKAQGTKVSGISGGRLAQIDVCFPQDKKEQQKIADCLSSADKLITAVKQKLAALQDHKKGLMQQLFPIQGSISR